MKTLTSKVFGNNSIVSQSQRKKKRCDDYLLFTIVLLTKRVYEREEQRFTFNEVLRVFKRGRMESRA